MANINFQLKEEDFEVGREDLKSGVSSITISAMEQRPDFYDVWIYNNDGMLIFSEASNCMSTLLLLISDFLDTQRNPTRPPCYRLLTAGYTWDEEVGYKAHFLAGTIQEQLERGMEI